MCAPFEIRLEQPLARATLGAFFSGNEQKLGGGGTEDSVAPLRGGLLRSDVTHEDIFYPSPREREREGERRGSSACSGVRIVTPKTTGIKCPRPDRR